MLRSLSLVFAAAALLGAVHAKPEFPSRLPNGKNVPGVEALGHTDGTGTSDKLNKFGRAFDSAGRKWTVALCQADSDGDGQTNGQELGDPCCTWTSGGTPKFTTGVSHPGDASKTVEAAVLAAYSCNSSSTATSPAASTTTTAPSSSAATWTASVGATVALAAAATAWTQW